MPLQNRASIVCTQCHSRKIKCDLQTSPDGVCKNCRHSSQPCIRRRNGVRRRQRFKKPPQNSRPTQIDESLRLSPISDPLTYTAQPDTWSTGTRSSVSQNEGFVTHCSMIHLDGDTHTTLSEIAISKSFQDDILQTTQAAELPGPALLRARVETFLTQAFHHCPVVDQSEVSGIGPSILLQQGLYMVGNLIMHDPNGAKLSHKLYQKLKVLLSVNYETDPVQILKTVCLMSFWSLEPSNPINLDGPWKWTALGTQLAIQMGLHKESTYRGRSNEGCLRRIFWQLHNNDSLQVACWGRPPLLRNGEFDVKLPTSGDFENANIYSITFVETTKLCTIMSTISSLYMEKKSVEYVELLNIDTALCDWVRNLPETLQLYDSNGQRKAYFRLSLEIHLQYFVAIVMSQMLRCNERERPWQTSVLSRIAASCAASLYEEIYYREETVFLPSSHGFFCLAISLPLICHLPRLEAKIALRDAEISIVRSILQKMRGHYGDADMVLGKMQKLQSTIDHHDKPIDELHGLLSCPLEACIQAEGLFPFPPDICSNMDLLDLASRPLDGDRFVEPSLLRSEQSEDGVFGCSFMDLFNIDLNTFTFTEEDEST